MGVEDVFDTTGRPPEGWMNALFNDGPFMNDVGRCVPGPPPPDPLVVDAGSAPWTYRVVTVGSWSDPLNPIAIYAAELPVGPNAETTWWADRPH